MTSFKEFQKQRAREEARRAGKKPHDDDDDFEDEFFLGLSPGLWVQAIFFAGYWGLAAWLLHSGAGPRDPTQVGGLWLVSAVPALVLAHLTWRWIGSRAREVLTWAAFLSPLIIIGWLLLRGGKEEPSASEASTAPDVTAPKRKGPKPAAVEGQRPPKNIDERALLANSPDGIRALQDALEGDDPAHAEAAVRAMVLGQHECLSKVLGARQVPASTSALGSGLRCLRALHSLRPALRAWATGREQELVKGVRGEKRSAAITLALGFGRPEPEVLSALVPRLGSSLPHVAEGTLAALTELGLEAPQAVLEAVRAAPAKDSSLERINRLRLEARLEPSRAAGCVALAERVIQEDAEGSRLAVQALQELDGVCDEAAGPLLQHVRSARPPESPDPTRWAQVPQPELFRRLPAAQALAYTGLSRWAELWALEQEVGAQNGLLASALRTARRQLVENDQIRRMGVTALVLNHPSAMEGVERPEVVLGPCPLERLGASPGTEFPSVPECVLEVQGGSELTRPLTAWQAQASGRSLSDFEAALGPP